MARKQEAARSLRDELALWTRRFATTIAEGVPLFSALAALEEEETSFRFRDISREIRDRLSRGEQMSDAMRARPEVFDEGYIGSVRAGEIGGILDQTMKRMAERMEQGLALPSGLGEEQVSRAELAEWCWRFGHMLSAGVPLLVALETLSEFGHPALREIARRMREEAGAGSPLALTQAELRSGKPRPVIYSYPGLFGPVMRQLLTIGVNHASLDAMLARAAGLLDYEAKLEAQGKLPPLCALPGEAPEPPERRAEEHPVVKQVNAVLVSAFRAGAEGIELRATKEERGEAVVMKEGGAIETIPLDDYASAVRRVRIMAGIDPFSRDDRHSTIHVRHEGNEYEVFVRSFPEPLWLRIRKDTGAVQL